MKIGYVVSNFPSLSESFVLDELVELLNLGVEIYVFSIHRPSDSIQHEEFREHDFLGRTFYFSFDYKRLSEYSRSLFSLVPRMWPLLPSTQSNLARKAGKIVVAGEFADVAKRLDLDLLHAHFDANAETAAYLSQILNIPFTFTKHTPMYLSDSLRKLCEKAAGIITISEFNRKALVQIGVDPRKISVIHCGIRTDKFKQPFSDGPKTKSILSVCRLVEKKGIAYLIKALDLVRKKHDVRLHIVGSGPEERKLRELASRMGLNSSVDFYGNITDEQLVNLYVTSSIFVLPCISTASGDVDGIPVAIMEAMATGLPVISTTVSGIPEIVEDHLNGLLVKPKKPIELAESINQLLDDPRLCRIYGERGKTRVQTDFNVKQTAVALKSYFEQKVQLVRRARR